jgi:hypothetical protein
MADYFSKAKGKSPTPSVPYGGSVDKPPVTTSSPPVAVVQPQRRPSVGTPPPTPTHSAPTATPRAPTASPKTPATSPPSSSPAGRQPPMTVGPDRRIVIKQG